MQTPMVGCVLIVLHRVGPYHHARFQAAAVALQCPLLVLQTRPQSQEYPWSFELKDPQYTLISLQGGLNSEQDPPQPVLRHQLEELIDRHNPSVIVSVGWADQAYLQLMRSAQERAVPLVVVSDSRREDSPRSAVKELLKRQLIKGYSAGIVAGSQSRAYLKELGMPSEAIYQPWDVVDNQCFHQLASDARNSILPTSQCPFLCVGRFIPEKNHALLLQAYASYQLRGGMRHLLLVGAGPLELEVRAARARLPYPEAVQIEPFAPLQKLGHYYGQAHALVLTSSKDTWGLVVNEAMAAGLPVIVSRACGCVADLVVDGSSGWTFPAEDSESLVSCLLNSDMQTHDERRRMIEVARSRIEYFTPTKFAEGLCQACNYALTNRSRSFRSKFVASILLAQC